MARWNASRSWSSSRSNRPGSRCCIGSARPGPAGRRGRAPGWSARPTRGRGHWAGHREPYRAPAWQQSPSLLLACAAPHAINLARCEGKVEALYPDWAAGADHLGLIQLLGRGPRRRQRKEQLRIDGKASSPRTPVGICVHHRDQSSLACTPRYRAGTAVTRVFGPAHHCPGSRPLLIRRRRVPGLPGRAFPASPAVRSGRFPRGARSDGRQPAARAW